MTTATQNIEAAMKESRAEYERTILPARTEYYRRTHPRYNGSGTAADAWAEFKRVRCVAMAKHRKFCDAIRAH